MYKSIFEKSLDGYSLSESKNKDIVDIANELSKEVSRVKIPKESGTRKIGVVYSKGYIALIYKGNSEYYEDDMEKFENALDLIINKFMAKYKEIEFGYGSPGHERSTDMTILTPHV